MAGFASVTGLLSASHAGRDRRPTDLCLVAAAQYASACRCGGESVDTALAVSVECWAAPMRPPAGEALTVAKSDYDAFERSLGDIQTVFSAEDLSALRAKVTPEMLSYFSEQLAGNASRGLINRVTDVKLLRAICRKPGAEAIPTMRPWP